MDPAYGGSTYRKAITDYVHLPESNGMNVIVEMHLNAPGSQKATSQQKMADADHAPAFWCSVTARFGTDGAVVFDLYNEPHDISWACWLHGCTLPEGWKAVGMQSLVNAVRGAGGQNILMLGGLGWSGDLTMWGAYMPSDPLGQLVASWHVYNFGSCVTRSCWNANVTGVGGLAPILLGEFGETDCKHTFVDPLMAWADGRGLGYVAWTWDDWGGCNGPTVITNYDGTPSGFGQGVHDHYVARFPRPPLKTARGSVPGDRIRGEPGRLGRDDAELFPADIEHDPTAVGLKDGPGRAERLQAADLRLDVVRLDVEVDARLGGLRLRHLLDQQAQAARDMS